MCVNRDSWLGGKKGGKELNEKGGHMTYERGSKGSKQAAATRGASFRLDCGKNAEG